MRAAGAWELHDPAALLADPEAPGRCGGKGRSLLRLHEWGMPVPPFLILPSDRVAACEGGAATGSGGSLPFRRRAEYAGPDPIPPARLPGCGNGRNCRAASPSQNALSGSQPRRAAAAPVASAQ